MADKQVAETQVALLDSDSEARLKTRWQRIEAVIWDGGYRSEEERKLVRTLDIFILYDRI
jgi:ACS family pantothenate transporter-like MFS transporter